MTVVQMPDGANVDFGDLPPDQIRKLIETKFPDAAAKAQQPKISEGNAALRHFTNPFGISDEIGGVIEGVGDAIGLGPKDSDGGFWTGYNRFTKKANALDDAAFDQHPVASIAGLVGGSIVAGRGLPSVTAFTVPAKIAKTAPLLEKAASIATRTGARAGNAALTGGAYGAEYGAASAQGGPMERLQGGIEGGTTGLVTGGLIGAAAPAVVDAATAGVKKLFSPLAGALDQKREAARKAVEAWKIDRGNPEEVATALDASRKAGMPTMAMDMGEASRTLADSARNTSIEGRAILDRSLDARQSSQMDRTIDVIERAAPGVNAPQTRSLLEAAAARANKPAYDRAYFEGEKGIWNEGLQQLTVADEVQSAIKAATKTGSNKAAVEGTRPPKNPFIAQPDGTLVLQPGVKPTLRFWDSVKQNIDSEIGKAQRAGDNPRARDLTKIKQQLVAHLDAAVPSYQKARAGAAAFFGAENALDAGSNFVTQRADDFQAAKAAVEKMTPAERQLFKEGFAQTLINRLRETGDRRNIINSIFLNSGPARERIKLAMGESAAREMEAFLRLENIFALGKQIQGNSKTARRLFEMTLAGGAGVVVGGGDPLSPATWLKAASDPMALLAAALTYGAARGRVKVNQNIAREVARLLASDDPKVVKEAIARVAKSPSLLHSLRFGETELARLVAPAGGRGGQALTAGAPPVSADETQGDQ